MGSQKQQPSPLNLSADASATNRLAALDLAVSRVLLSLACAIGLSLVFVSQSAGQSMITNPSEDPANFQFEKTRPSNNRQPAADGDDLFGEDQAPGIQLDSFGEGSRRPAPRVPGSRVPRSRVPEIRPPATERRSPLTKDPLDGSITPIPPDGSGRTPLPSDRRSAESSRRRSRQGEPQLPPGGEMTPDPESVPDLPTPGGRVRSTERARSIFAKDEPDLETPDGFEGLDDFEIDDLAETDDSSDRRRSDRGLEPGRRRPLGSNVYRPAPDPSYYRKPTDESVRNYQLYAQQYFLQYGQYPPAPNAVNPYSLSPNASNPYASNPYAGVPYAGANYGANPRMPSVAGYGCPPCPPCQPVQPSLLAAANCGCQPNAAGVAQSFHNPASSPSPVGLANDVYNGVVCGDREIAACTPAVSPPALAATGRLRGDGPLLFYTSFFGGWTGLNGLGLSGEDGSIDIGDEDGVALGLAFGQIQGKNLRSEVELTYRTNDLDGMSLQNLAGDNQFFAGTGTIDSFSVMFNVFWDFVDVPTARFKPYLGGGIGGVSVDADFQIGDINRFDDGNDTSLAYQWIAGINYQTNQYSNLFVEYRYFAADSLHFRSTLPADSILDGDGELDYSTNNILFGMRMKF